MDEYDCYISRYTGEQIDEAIGLVLAGKAILITNCPNCGAPVNGSVCEYCGTRFASSQNEITMEIDGEGLA